MTALGHAYRILVVSAVDKFCEQLMPLLPESIAPTVDRASSVNQAQRKIADRQYDVVIVNTPLPDDFGVRFAIDVSAGSSTVVMLLVHTDFYDAVYDKVCQHGVFVVRRPTSPALVRQSVDWLVATRERLRTLEKKSVSLQDKMNEIRLVNRAKWALISHLNMTEEAAHRYIEKQAMDRCVPRRTVAEDILRTYKD